MIAFPLILLLLADTCGPAPLAPPQTEAWAVQVSELVWRTEVPGWVPAPAPECWKLGRVELVYETAADEGKPAQEPGPWIVTDYPAGEACPVQAIAGCWDVVDYKQLVRVP